MNQVVAARPSPTLSLRVPLVKFVRNEGAGASRFALAVWVLTALVLASVSRASVGAQGVLSFGALMLPMLTFTIVGRVVGTRGLVVRATEFARMGASRSSTAAAHVAVAVGLSALFAAVLGVLFVIVAHREGDPALTHDLPATFAASFVCGATYAAYFAWGSTFRDGMGRSLFLGLDFVLGGASGLSLLLPRAHLRSLLGGENAGALRPGASMLAVVVLAVVFGSLAVLRAKRAR